MIGTQISHYRLTRKLGAGTYGEVYEAEHIHDPELRVAVKLVAPSLAEDAHFVEALKRECRALDRMDHLNVVRFRDLIVSDGRVAMVLELLDGQDLHDRLSGGPLPVGVVVTVIEAILEGLAYAHSRGVMHRDVKPSNVFCCKDGRIKLLDFGIARAADGSQATKTGQMIGTLDYMAPERFDERGGSKASDVYAVGLIAWELLAGKPACPDGEFGRKLGWHLAQGLGDATKVKMAVPGCPGWLADVIAGLAAKDPDARPSDGAAAIAALRASRPSEAAEPAATEPPGRRAPPPTVRGPKLEVRPGSIPTPAPASQEWARERPPEPLIAGGSAFAANSVRAVDAPHTTGPEDPELGRGIGDPAPPPEPNLRAIRKPSPTRSGMSVVRLGLPAAVGLALLGSGAWWLTRPTPQEEYAAYLAMQPKLFGDDTHPGDPTADDVRKAAVHLQRACVGGVPTACLALANVLDSDSLPVSERLPLFATACTGMIQDCVTMQQCEDLYRCQDLKAQDIGIEIAAAPLAASMTAACQASPPSGRISTGSPCADVLDFVRSKTWSFGALSETDRISVARTALDLMCGDRAERGCVVPDPCWVRESPDWVTRVYGDYEESSAVYREFIALHRCR